MKITVGYFALLRECAGRSEELLDTPSHTALELYHELAGRYGFALKPQQVKVAINERFAALDTPLAHGDTVVFIPPVAGG